MKNRAGFREEIFSPLALGHGVGEVLYYIGFETEYTLLRFARACKHAVLWVFYGVLLVLRTLGSFAQAFCAPWGKTLRRLGRQLRQGLRNLRTMLRAEREEGGPVAGKGVAYVVRGVRAYRDLVYNALSYLLPVAALLVLVVTVRTVLGSNFALAVQYRGEFVGYIESESVFEEAQNLVRDRIRGENTGEDWAAEPGIHHRHCGPGGHAQPQRAGRRHHFHLVRPPSPMPQAWWWMARWWAPRRSLPPSTSF